MRKILLSALILILISHPAKPASQGDPAGVWAVIDKVVFEPNAQQPQRVQIWGVFAVADPAHAQTTLQDDRGYHSPERGYLYFKLPDISTAPPHESAEVWKLRLRYKLPDTLNEWVTLSASAGKHEAMGFCLRYLAEAFAIRVRKADEAPRDPDTYISADGDAPRNPDGIKAFNYGLFSAPDGSVNHAPIRLLLESKPN